MQIHSGKLFINTILCDVFFHILCALPSSLEYDMYWRKSFVYVEAKYSCIYKLLFPHMCGAILFVAISKSTPCSILLVDIGV